MWQPGEARAHLPRSLVRAFGTSWLLLAGTKQPKELGLVFSSHELGIITKTHLERCKIYATERMFIALMVSVFFNESLMNPFFSSFSLGGSSLGCSLIAASFAFLAVL